MGRPPNTDERRAQIIEALLLEMSAVGYQRATTKSIATRAGLAPGLLHYHFKSKEAVLLALIDGLLADADRRLSDALAAPLDAETALRTYIDCRVGRGASANARQVNAWVQLMAEGIGQGPVRKRLGAWLNGERKRLDAWFAGAGVTESASAAAGLLAMILGSFSLHALPVKGIPAGYAQIQINAWLSALIAPG